MSYPPKHPGIIGDWQEDPGEGRVPMAYHAFIMLDGVHPHVISYDDTEEGLAELADRMCEGKVLSVVYGRMMEVSVDTVVGISDGAEVLNHAIPTSR